MLGIADPCHSPTIISDHFECKHSIKFLDNICIEETLALKSLVSIGGVIEAIMWVNLAYLFHQWCDSIILRVNGS